MKEQNDEMESLHTVPHSAGTNVPSIAIPDHACDCHHHIYDPLRFPYNPEDKRGQPSSTVQYYRKLQTRLGTTRNVIVTPSAYGTDNRCTLDALLQMGSNSRAVVVVDSSVTEAELSNMHDFGVRGIRFNISTGAPKDFALIQSLAERIADFGWHIQFWMKADDTVEMSELLNKLACPIVFDHLGGIPLSVGIRHPACKIMCSLMEQGKAWVKLSGLYHLSLEGPPYYSDTLPLAAAFIETAPERVIWGSDWPHPSMYSAGKPMPNDADLIELLAVQSSNQEIFYKILVDNPARLYNFK
ncbi:amidohydrolase family protein [Paenibacillus jiagnxiensis]|uniref:amidohydrolase family protein n=1 Tax=Paenibacillus jiagnxiensis TaxID=3228926 RepID=UPI0033AACF52